MEEVLMSPGVQKRIDYLIRRLARAFQLNRHDAEDARQDLVLRIWQVGQQYDPSCGTTKSTFAYCIANRWYREQIAARRADKPNVCSLDQLPEALEIIDPRMSRRTEEVDVCLDGQDCLQEVARFSGREISASEVVCGVPRREPLGFFAREEAHE